MQLATLFQILAACLGIVGSLFFAIGIIRQSTEIMAKLTGTYWGHNPHMIFALASQKAEYVFGGCVIVLAFLAQLISFLVPASAAIGCLALASSALLLTVPITVILFLILKLMSRRLARHYEAQIMKLLQ
jgi:hypothetical protein